MLFYQKQYCHNVVLEQPWTICSFVSADSVCNKLLSLKKIVCFGGEGVSFMLFY